MSKVKEKKKKDEAITRGLFTSLFFLVSFLLLRYPLLLSLIFACLSGILMILISFWWLDIETTNQETLPPPENIETEDKKKSNHQKNWGKNAPGLIEVQQKRKLEIQKKNKYQTKKKSKIFGLFSRKKKK